MTTRISLTITEEPGSEPTIQLTVMVLPPLTPLWRDFQYFGHQDDGVRWMLEKERVGTEVPDHKGNLVTVHGGFQCDDMGLGKTIQIAAVMVHHVVPHTLLLAPLAMLETWSEVCQHAGMKVYEVGKEGWVRVNPKSGVPMHLLRSRPSVYISNYEKLHHRSSLFQQNWDRVVLDEAHKIRNGGGLISIHARKLVAPIRWAVTGTPLVNSKKDVVSLLAFLGVPFSRTWRWEPRYDRMLPELILHRSLQKLRSVIEGAPPIPIMETKVLPFQTAEEEDFYRGVQGKAAALLERYSMDVLSNTQKFLLLLRLRQISVHPQVYINAKRRENPVYGRADWEGKSTKMEAIREIIQGDTGSHNYLIFCQFNDEMALLHDFLVLEGLADEVLMYHGGMNQRERAEVLQKSKVSTKRTVLLLQLQAGGVGLNLQEYDRILFVSPWWTSALMDQAIARAVRMGQKKVVKVYHLRLSAEHESTINIDTLINDKADTKRVMLERLFSLCQ